MRSARLTSAPGLPVYARHILARCSSASTSVLQRRAYCSIWSSDWPGGFILPHFLALAAKFAFLRIAALFAFLPLAIHSAVTPLNP